jgi:hypothetical protein
MHQQQLKQNYPHSQVKILEQTDRLILKTQLQKFSTVFNKPH